MDTETKPLSNLGVAIATSARYTEILTWRGLTFREASMLARANRVIARNA